MRILLIHQYFKTPQEGGSIRSYYLAKGMLDHGHEVVVVTAANRRRKRIVNIEGIEVHYLPVHYENRFGFGRRVFAFLYFALYTSYYVRKFKDFDLAYVMSTPLTTGLVARRLHQHYGIKYFFEVGDLWPQAPIQMGVIKNRWLQNLLFKLERTAYEHAAMVVALSPAIQQEISTVIGPEKTCVVTNMADVEFFSASTRQGEKRNFSAQSPYRVIYLGAAGKANHLDYYLQAAKYSLDKTLPVVFYIMAEGAELARIKILAIEQGLTNLEFIPFQGKEGVRDELEQMDAVYISYRNVPVLQTGSPNKLFDGLAAGKQIVINFGGWIRDLVESNDCGFYANAEHPEELASKIMHFLQHPTLIERQQQNARKLAEDLYSRKKQMAHLAEVLIAFEGRIK